VPLHERIADLVERTSCCTADRIVRCASISLVFAWLAACGPHDTSTVAATVTDPQATPVSVLATISAQQATVGVPYTFDAARSSSAFRSLRATGLTYRVTFAPSADGLTATQGRIAGTLLAAGTVNVVISATDATGRSASDAFVIVVSGATAAVRLASANTPQGATVGNVYSYDASKGGSTFVGPGLSYAVSFSPSTNGLSASGARIIGTPAIAGTVTATIVATDAAGRTATNAFPIVMFSNDLVAPTSPPGAYGYADASAPLPAHFLGGQGGRGGPQGSVIATDNTPATNITTDAGAALGRVLLYDRR